MQSNSGKVPSIGQSPRKKFQTLDNRRGKSSKHWTIPAAVLPMLGICAALMNPAPLQADEAEDSSPAALERMTGRLADLRLEIANEKREWSRQKPRWQRELELLKREKRELRQELDEYAQERSGEMERRQALLARRDELEQALRRLSSSLRRAEMNLDELLPRLPEYLLGDLEQAFDDLPGDDAQASAMPLTRRLQRVLAIYSGLQKLQHDIHALRAIVPLPSGEREMDILQIGLATAYAVSADGSMAAVSTPAEGGRSWQPRPELAEAVAAAIAVHRREEPARLVELPLSSGGGAE